MHAILSQVLLRMAQRPSPHPPPPPPPTTTPHPRFVVILCVCNASRGAISATHRNIPWLLLVVRSGKIADARRNAGLLFVILSHPPSAAQRGKLGIPCIVYVYGFRKRGPFCVYIPIRWRIDCSPWCAAPF